MRGEDQFFYKLLVTPRHGLHEGGNMRDVVRNPLFYVGARFTLLGSDDPASREAAYRVSWQRCEVPATAETASRLTIPIAITNSGSRRWRAGGDTQVRLTYVWLNEAGVAVESPSFRETRLRADVPPGANYRTTMAVHAPRQPGSYRLVIDPARQRVGRFPPRDGGSCDRSVVVTRPADE